MAAKKIYRGDSCTQKLLTGVREVSTTVRVTMGPRGQNIIIEQPGRPPLVTKDGVTVAREITLEDGVEQMGASLVIDAARKTADQAGDGTTCAAVLSQAIFEKGYAKLKSNISRIRMCDGIKAAVKNVETFLKDKCSREVSDQADLINIATIAANGDKPLGDLIGKAMEKIGIDGCIIVQDGGEGDVDTVTYVEGMQIRSGMRHSLFSNVQGRANVCEFTDPLVLVTNRSLNSVNDIVPMLEYAAAADRPLVVFAKDFGADVIQTMLVNRMKATVAICAIKIPDYAEVQQAIAEDIAAVVGGVCISDTMEIDLRRVGKSGSTFDWKTILGTCSTFKADRLETTLVHSKHDDGRQARVNARLKHAKEVIAASNDNGMKDKQTRRIAALSGGVAKLAVSARTEAERGQKKARVEDALFAVRAAADEGIVAGGGCALFYAAQHLKLMKVEDDSERAGFEIIADAIEEPLKQIAFNADEKFQHVVPETLLRSYKDNNWNGWDADQNVYGDMYEFGIIDPVKVPITALNNAASVAMLLLTTGGTIEFLQPEDAEHNAARGHHKDKA